MTETLVAAMFDDCGSAQRAARMLTRDPGIYGTVAVVGPGDPLLSVSPAPDERAPARSGHGSPALFGAMGLLAGGAAAMLLILEPLPLAAAAPGLTFVLLAVTGALLGLVASGLETPKPDVESVVRQVRDSLRRRKWAVIVRPLSRVRAKVAFASLQAMGAAPIASL